MPKQRQQRCEVEQNNSEVRAVLIEALHWVLMLNEEYFKAHPLV
jgi:hypothetical protein